jgi:pimeloyl-ACP methyl ester carboxylesterase
MPDCPSGSAVGLQRLEPLATVRAGFLDVAYFEAGPADGKAVLLLHGFPYDIHSYVEVIPLLASAGLRVIAPYLRGQGPTRFADPAAPRSGQQAAIGADVVDLLDALRLDQAILAGYDWGGRAACVAAALWPDRCAGLVSVNGYLIQDITAASDPIAPDLEAGFWYLYYFSTERGRRGLTANRRAIAKVIWARNSPDWQFSEATLNRTAAAFENEEYVDTVVHSCRHGLGLADGHPAYDEVEQMLAAQPPITVPTITLDGEADGTCPATDGSAQAALFTGARIHRRIRGAGHNLPQESPQAFANAVLDLADGSG